MTQTTETVIPNWELNQALARISSLLGVHQAAHNFETESLPEEARSGALDKKLVTLWERVHVEGEIQAADWSNLHQSNLKHLTGLLINNSDSRFTLVRGLEAADYLVVENSDLSQSRLLIDSIKDSHTFYLFSVQPFATYDVIHQGKPMSAKDWFTFVISKRRKQISDGILATFVMNSLALGTAMYSMQVYDRVVPSQSYSTLIVLTVGAFIAIGFELLLRQVRAKMIDETFKSADLELSSVFFNKALGIRLDARPNNFGTFISEIRQFESIRAFMTSATLYVLADAPFAIFFSLIMMFVGAWLGLIPLAFVFIMLTLGFIHSSKLKETNQAILEEGNRKNGFLIESMDGIESIKASSGEPQLLRTWQRMNQSQGERELYLKNISTSSSTSSAALQQIAYISIVALGVTMIHNNQLTMGGLIGCTILSGRILGPLTQIPQLLVQWGQIKGSIDGLNRIMSLPTDTDNHDSAIIPDKVAAKLNFEQVTFEYHKDQKSVVIEDLNLLPGEIVAIMGKVGSGKSTLLKLLSGLYKPNQGRVLLDNLDITHLSSGFVREQIGYLPQDVRLIRGTLKDNLTLGLPFASDQQVLEATEKVGLDRLVKRHPAGINLPISEGGLGLSGGQKQMVALARLFLANPKILLLDEPTASLDGELENHVIHQLIKNMSRDKMLVIVSHKPSVLRFATRLIIVDNGRIIQNGPRDEVLGQLKSMAEKQKAQPNNTL